MSFIAPMLSQPTSFFTYCYYCFYLKRPALCCPC